MVDEIKKEKSDNKAATGSTVQETSTTAVEPGSKNRIISRDNSAAGDSGCWALVLMGGGARALAHIGVLEALVANDLMPPIITGTSMGAILGGLFAAGYLPPELEKLSRQLSYSRVASLRKTRIPVPDKLVDYLMLESYQKRLLRRIGLEKGDLLEKSLRQLVGEVLIEELPIHFGCNAVDLVSGQEINFTRGPLYRALRASMAFPFVIEPVRFGGRLLVDGGLLNNCPIRLARELGATKVFVPDVHRPLKKMSLRHFDSTFIMVHRLVQVVLADSTEGKLPEADLVININPDVDTFDFRSVRRVVNLGRRITLENIGAIKELARSAG
ncbi:MAG: patatin-like phospholipase family protein [Candidatus Saccharicenans sp.]|uniref:patatin-like phospholipase family protein n=1 Tax=Candidatus Saccharicenans sp. TaxID=2819258 RepID=UPI00404A2E42